MMVYLAWAIFVAGALADAWTTDYARDRYKTKEVVPIVGKALDWLEKKFGDPAEYIYKAVFIVAFAFLKPPWELVIALGLFQFLVAGWNCYVIRKAEKKNA